jgi:hypothetical protein
MVTIGECSAMAVPMVVCLNSLILKFGSGEVMRSAKRVELSSEGIDTRK